MARGSVCCLAPDRHRSALFAPDSVLTSNHSPILVLLQRLSSSFVPRLGHVWITEAPSTLSRSPYPLLSVAKPPHHYDQLHLSSPRYLANALYVERFIYTKER